MTREEVIKLEPAENRIINRKHKNIDAGHRGAKCA